MEILSGIDPQVLVLDQQFRGTMPKEVYETIVAELNAGKTSWIVEFENTAFLDSAAIGSLVALAKEFSNADAVLTLRNLNEEIADLFTRTNLDMLFNIETHSGFVAARSTALSQKKDDRLLVTSDSVGDVGVLCLAGKMNHPTGSNYFRQQFLLAMARYKRIILDFGGITFFDSSGLGVLLTLNKLLQDTGGGLRLCNIAEPIEDDMRDLGIDDLIPFFKKADDALVGWKTA